MAWCHACEEKKRIEKTVTGEFMFNKETFKKFVERERRQKRSGFSFRIVKKK